MKINEKEVNYGKQIFKDEYLPYIIKWGKLTTWLSIFFIILPPLVLTFVFGARVTVANVLSGLFPAATAMIAWYIVDPIALYPILQVPGLYITYIAGNSKEIRAPSALMSMEASGLKQGTPEGTVIATFGIALSVYISVFALTIGVIGGNFIITNAPDKLLHALTFLLPALFGALLGQRIVDTPKYALISLPLAILSRIMYVNGLFIFLPSGGGYMQIIITVFGTMGIVKFIEDKKQKQNTEE